VHLSTLSGYTSTVNGSVSSLSGIRSTISSSKYSLAEKDASLDQMNAGTDTLDLASAQLSVTQRENALADARETLADYSVRAPFSGTLATLTAHRGDSVSSGTALGTLITKDQVASITLNEVDAAKMKIGQRATLSFDAIDSLTLTGKVASIDTVGTVSQGVVNYTVTIAFDSGDERVKPGMTVTASIITDTAQDTLIVPSSAVKTVAGANYVEIFPDAAAGTATLSSKTAPERVSVTTGLSDDTDIEIISGLSEGQMVVTKTTTAATTAKATTPSATSLLGGSSRTGTGTSRSFGGGAAIGR
jgi:HlyD family secretion protein